jgi:hypothetical protein
MICMSVDFPDPDGPMIATNSPSSIVRLISKSTGVATPSFSYALYRFFISMSFIILLRYRYFAALVRTTIFWPAVSPERISVPSSP